MNIQELEPLFDFNANTSSILIHKSRAEICIDKNTYVGDGEICLELLPRANIVAYGYFKNILIDNKDILFKEDKVSSFSIDGRQIDGFILGSEFNISSGEYHLKWCPNLEPIQGVGNDSTQISFLVFHLFNFPDFCGVGHIKEKEGLTEYFVNHIDLNCDEWNVAIKSLTSTKKNIKKLQKEGGYCLTHIGKIKKIDDSLFCGKNATQCLQALGFFLSFAKGGWCEPICVVGFDTQGNQIWKLWSSPKEAWHTCMSWFDSHHGSQLVNLFPGFMNRWKNAKWNEALREVIYWYLNANFSSRGIDAGIILTQAAIERLSYEYTVKDKCLLTIKGFKDLRASDKFRLLFSSLNIPIKLLDKTPELEALSQQFKWLDAQHGLTEIRNSLVHPEHKTRGQADLVIYEAWNLGLWFLEMGLLAICNYSDTFGNRLVKERWVGQVEDVPWKNL